MMIHFDDVLNKARSIIETDADAAQIQHVTVLRDLRGRIRLFLKPPDGNSRTLVELIKRLEPQFVKELGGFWGKLIEPDVTQSEMANLIASVRTEEHAIPGPGFEKWSIIERHVSKSAWFGKSGDPPWPLQEQTPAIISFFSHKGGVGRTTALCAAAINLARAGQRVVVIDLDLEAPGIATLLTETVPALGVTDYFLERLLEHQPSIDDFVSVQDNPELISSNGEPIYCVTAGQLTESYIEKLARLDYELLVTADTNKNPMIGMLKDIRKTFSPSLILLDCRAGLHDLGGIALQQLSHLNVVFGLDSEQSWQGLRLVIRQIGLSQGRLPDCLMIQALEPPPGTGEIRERSRARFLTDSYNAFLQYYYEDSDSEPAPNIDDQDAPHYPFHIAYEASLAGYRSLRDVDEILTTERFREFTANLARRVGKPFNSKA